MTDDEFRRMAEEDDGGPELSDEEAERAVWHDRTADKAMEWLKRREVRRKLGIVSREDREVAMADALRRGRRKNIPNCEHDWRVERTEVNATHRVRFMVCSRCFRRKWEKRRAHHRQWWGQ